MKYTGKDGTLRIYDGSSNYLEVHFRNLDFSGAIGRPKREEILVLDGGNADTYAHYISGNDQVLFDALPVSFSCFIDDITHVNTTNGFKEILVQALECRDARNDETDGTWTTYGVTTKGSTQNISGTNNPVFNTVMGDPIIETTILSVNETSTLRLNFAGDTTDQVYNACMCRIVDGDLAGYTQLVSWSGDDTGEAQISIPIPSVTERPSAGDTIQIFDNIRTVDLQFRMEGPTNDIVYKYAECFFPLDEITITEAEDAINMSVTGGVYGTITRHADWA